MSRTPIVLSQRVENFSSFGERRDCLDQAWAPLLEQFGIIPLPIPNQISEPKSFLIDLNIKGVILTGGNDLNHFDEGKNKAPERDKLEYQLVSLCTAMNLPLLGVCRGMQLLVHFYGGKISSINNHIGKTHKVELNKNCPWKGPRHSEVNSFHNFGIKKEDLSENLVILGEAFDNSVEAIRHKTKNQWGIMWHPERFPKSPWDFSLLSNLFKA